MPLIVTTGYPRCGKSTLCSKINDHLSANYEKEVVLIKECDYLTEDRNVIYNDESKEKNLRAKLKSEVQRVLNDDNIVILDGLNYIKGYRYELYCVSKAVPTKQVTIYCRSNVSNPNPDDSLGEYSKETYANLTMRYEEPNEKSRWDSPLLDGAELDIDDLYKILFESKKPKQNKSTMNTPISESNYLQRLEILTSNIIQGIQETKQIRIKDSIIDLEDKDVTMFQLAKYKRQFINMKKNSLDSSIEFNGDVFLNYLASQLV